LPDWIEGEDYKVLEGGKVECLHCNKVLSGKAGLGPHLSACPSRKGKQDKAETPETTEQEYLAEAKVVKDALERYGVAKTAITRILKTIQTHSTYLQNAFELRALITAHIPKRSGTVDLIVQEILKEVNPSSLPGFRSQFLQGSQQGGSQVMTVAKWQELRRQERLEDENKRLREKLAEKGSSGTGTSDEVWKEREARMKAEFALLVNQSTTEKYNQGYREGRAEKIGKTTLDVISELGTKFDERVEQMMIKTAKFNPDKKYSPKQRKEKAKQISEKLEKKEEILEAENALIVSAHKMMTERSNKHD